MAQLHFRQRFLRILLPGAIACLLNSCVSTGTVPAPEQEQPVSQEESAGAEESANDEKAEKTFADGSPVVTSRTAGSGGDSILLSFAGDIMAHTPNTARGHYDKIYEDIEPLIRQSRLSFANMETPVDDDKPFSSYPQFNVHHTYADAAIAAGFNVFSLANNHTNDQGLSGIRATQKYFAEKEEKTKWSSRPVYASGLKDSPQSPFSYRVITDHSWTVLFLAVTEILNQGSYSGYINYVKSDEASRNAFIDSVRKLREENPCDLFVLSVHCNEPEYVLSVKKSQREFYRKLLDAGVDVLWANHPHVSKEWEVITDQDNEASKIIFYAMGNTISAQRYKPAFKDPSDTHEYTGDGYIAQVRFQKKREGGVRITWVNPVLITTYITTDALFVIRRLDDAFIEELTEEQRRDWATYLEERKKLMEKIEGKTLWQ